MWKIVWRELQEDEQRLFQAGKIKLPTSRFFQDVVRTHKGSAVCRLYHLRIRSFRTAFTRYYFENLKFLKR
jgi:hypothetical protein